MSNSVTPVVEGDNLSRAWSIALLRIMDRGGTELQPLLFSITGFAEIPRVHTAVNSALTTIGCDEVETVANTIFPFSVWQRWKADRRVFFKRYLEILPRLAAMDKKHRNDRGTYFSRMIAWDIDPKTGIRPVGNQENAALREGNQLEFIISQYNSRPGVRRSMFRACVFDPMRDHVTQAQLGFPCMEDVTFVPNNADETLTLNASYPTQQLFTKAYGNLLGLARLGMFMAAEMKLRLTRLNCFVGVEKLDTPGKTSPALANVVSIAREVVGQCKDGIPA